jgi:hypothetical protein
MKKILRYISSMPFAFTMKHYQVFGDSTAHMKDQALLSPESWDTLRKEHPFFSISTHRDEWLAASELKVKKDGQDSELADRATHIVSFLREHHIRTIFSVGSGGAALEYQLKKMMPDLEVTCSDYSPVTVETLKRVFMEADRIVQFDMQQDSWDEVSKYLGEHGVCLMYRIDAGLSDHEWQEIFERMYRAGIKQVLVIPSGTLTLMSIYNRKRRELKWMFTGVQRVWSGYLRTTKRFRQQWTKQYADHEYRFGGLKGFFLERREKTL